MLELVFGIAKCVSEGWRAVLKDAAHGHMAGRHETGSAVEMSIIGQGGSKILMEHPGSNFLSRKVLLNQPPT